MTLDKLTSNRKILRRIDRNLANHGRYIGAAYFSLLLVISIAGCYVEYPRISIGFGAALLFSALVMVYFSLRFDPLYASGPARWRQRFVWVHWFNTGCWGLFAAIIVSIYGITANSFLVILLSVCSGAIINVEWAPFNRANCIAQSLLFVPLGLTLVWLKTTSGFIVGCILLVAYAALLRQSIRLSRRYWDLEKNTHELNVQTRDLAYAVKEANSASQVKAEFLANVTHEIRTPMSNVLGMLALLDDTDLNQQQKRLQHVAVHSGESLLSLIDDVLDYARIVAGDIVFDEKIFNLRRGINQSLELLGPLAHRKGIELSVLYEQNIPLRIRCDENRMVQIINNLVTSILHNSHGSEIVIKIGLQKQSQKSANLRVDVLDNGPGLDEASQQALFETFSTPLQDVSNSMSPGAGLGLAIAKGLVEAQQGAIGFNTDLTSGAHFWFYIAVNVSTQQAQIDFSIKPLIGKSVLIVDVSPGMTEALSAELRALNINAVSVAGDQHVIDELRQARLEERDYELIIINYPLRSEIQFALLKQLEADTTIRCPKVLLMASLSQRAAYQPLLDTTLETEWLTKPVTRLALVNSFNKLYQLPLKLPELQNSMGSFCKYDAVRKVLLVEDNRVNQIVARGMLRKLGYSVSIANNGKEALSLMQDTCFDLILMDCRMPELNGYDTTLKIREMEQGTEQHIPIIAMTASVVNGEQTRCMSVGMDDFLAKPINIENLNAKLSHWLKDVDVSVSDQGLVNLSDTEQSISSANAWGSQQPNFINNEGQA